MVPLDTVVSVQVFGDVAKDLLTMQSTPCSDTEVMLLLFMIRNASLLKVLPARSVKALRGTNKELYGLIRDYTSSVMAQTSHCSSVTAGLS